MGLKITSVNLDEDLHDLARFYLGNQHISEFLRLCEEELVGAAMRKKTPLGYQDLRKIAKKVAKEKAAKILEQRKLVKDEHESLQEAEAMRKADQVKIRRAAVKVFGKIGKDRVRRLLPLQDPHGDLADKLREVRLQISDFAEIPVNEFQVQDLYYEICEGTKPLQVRTCTGNRENIDRAEEYREKIKMQLSKGNKGVSEEAHHE